MSAAFRDAPTVSVVLPVYNAASTLPAAVASILGQSFTDLELIVVDDGSTDGSREFARGLDDDRVRLVGREERAGLVASLNEGVTAARAEWVARMDADDVAHPDRLAAQLSALRRWPDSGMSATGCNIVDARGRVIATRRPPPDHASVAFSLHFGNVLTHPTVMFRRKLFVAVGGYRAERFPAEDYDLWVRVARRTRVVTIPELLLSYRRSEHGVTKTQGSEQYALALAIASDALEETTGCRPSARVVSGLVGLEPRLGCSDFAEASQVVLATRDAVRRDCRARGIDPGRVDVHAGRMLRRSGLRRSSGGLCFVNAASLSTRRPNLAVRVAGQYLRELRTRVAARR
jgi:GT2 family glycosyltransferase